jgi:hypothetical protein
LDVEIMNLKAIIKQIATRLMSEAKMDIDAVSEFIDTEIHMPETQAAPNNTPVVANLNTAIQIALALKSIDSSRTVDQVQAATNAALGALYPVAAAV